MSAAPAGTAAAPAGPGRLTTVPAGPVRPAARPRRWRLSELGSVAAALVLAGGLAVGGPAPAAEAAACPGTSGVTVVVDFGGLGGGIQVGCAAGNPASGLAALSGAGHGYTFVPRQLGLVCQIDAKPNPCNGAPTTAYWAYWHATRGGSWSYSTDGAGGYHPAPGTVEGWAFGAGRRPGIAPPAPPPAPKPTTKSAPEPTTRPPAPPPAPPGTAAPPGAPGSSTGTGATPGRAGTGAGAPVRSSASAVPPGSSAAPSTSAGATATAGASTAVGSAPSTSDPGPPGAVATEPAASSSKALGAFSLAVALITALGLAGFLVARRRRATPP